MTFASLHGPIAAFVAVSRYGVARPRALSGSAGTMSVQFVFGSAAGAPPPVVVVGLGQELGVAPGLFRFAGAALPEAALGAGIAVPAEPLALGRTAPADGCASAPADGCVLASGMAVPADGCVPASAVAVPDDGVTASAGAAASAASGTAARAAGEGAPVPGSALGAPADGTPPGSAVPAPAEGPAAAPPGGESVGEAAGVAPTLTSSAPFLGSLRRPGPVLGVRWVGVALALGQPGDPPNAVSPIFVVRATAEPAARTSATASGMNRRNRRERFGSFQFDLSRYDMRCP
ncbi:hypothetical protein GCM10010151_29970 [Actinoallomurus spadix]|uniref:Uncharacterized protein n=1 Tax=Actinoallomurus spadix TaxID=79912 RepID=A0ABN0WI48_9ACTN